LLKGVPYVSSNKEIKLGILISELTMAGDTTAPPSTHVAMFMGDCPCDQHGAPISKIHHSSPNNKLGEDLVANHMFSSKPVQSGRYDNYYDKMTAYTSIIASQAQALNSDVSPHVFPVISTEDDEGVFRYLDTATSRAGINLPAKKLELEKLAIIGLGGTGSYILDLVAKTGVKEIHLFDEDAFLSHNAFRSPGAASIDELAKKPSKVGHLKEIYSKMRRGIIAHEYSITSNNVDELDGMDFVFICVDGGDVKRCMVEKLEGLMVPFIDVGMGVTLVDDTLTGILRTTTSTPDNRNFFRSRVSLGDSISNNDYESNIQIADLNALNAALAVVKWKKLCGYYLDYQNEHNCIYGVNCNTLICEDES